MPNQFSNYSERQLLEYIIINQGKIYGEIQTIKAVVNRIAQHNGILPQSKSADNNIPDGNFNDPIFNEGENRTKFDDELKDYDAAGH